MSITYNMIMDELEYKHPWLYKYGVIKCDVEDEDRAYIKLGNGASYIYDINRPKNKLRFLTNSDDIETTETEEDWRCAFSYELERRMAYANITAKELARELEVSTSQIRRYLNESSSPSAWMLIRMGEIRLMDIKTIPIKYCPFCGEEL